MLTETDVVDLQPHPLCLGEAHSLRAEEILPSHIMVFPLDDGKRLYRVGRIDLPTGESLILGKNGNGWAIFETRVCGTNGHITIYPIFEDGSMPGPNRQKDTIWGVSPDRPFFVHADNLSRSISAPH